MMIEYITKLTRDFVNQNRRYINGFEVRKGSFCRMLTIRFKGTGFEASHGIALDVLEEIGNDKERVKPIVEMICNSLLDKMKERE